jgi:hypothetical protein
MEPFHTIITIKNSRQNNRAGGDPATFSKIQTSCFYQMLAEKDSEPAYGNLQVTGFKCRKSPQDKNS